MQWWCAVQEGVVWSWEWQAYPGVWLFIGLLIAGYVRLTRRVGDEEPTAGSGHRLAAAAGIFSLWAALDWPIGPLGAGYLASVHMVQYLLIAVIGPSLLLAGVPPAAWDRLARREGVVQIVRLVTAPPLAVLLFAGTAIITHLPSVVDPMMRSQFGSFGLDLTWFVTGLIFWWPILAPVPVRKSFPPLMYLIYFFPVMATHTGISVYFVFSRYPIYATYELAPPTGWITAVGDQQVAGGLMWVVGSTIMWGIIGGVVLKWMRSEEKERDYVEPHHAPAVAPIDTSFG